jgi:hypothetical protein
LSGRAPLKQFGRNRFAPIEACKIARDVSQAYVDL